MPSSPDAADFCAASTVSRCDMLIFPSMSCGGLFLSADSAMPGEAASPWLIYSASITEDPPSSFNASSRKAVFFLIAALTFKSAAAPPSAFARTVPLKLSVQLTHKSDSAAKRAIIRKLYTDKEGAGCI